MSEAEAVAKEIVSEIMLHYEDTDAEGAQIAQVQQDQDAYTAYVEEQLTSLIISIVGRAMNARTAADELARDVFELLTSGRGGAVYCDEDSRGWTAMYRECGSMDRPLIGTGYCKTAQAALAALVQAVKAQEAK